MPPDERDIAAGRRIAAATAALYRAILHGAEPQQIVAAMAAQLTAMIESRDAAAERPSDEPLRRSLRALERL